MKRKEFIDLFFEKGEFKTKADAERKTDAFIKIIAETLIKGEEIAFLGFGKFEVVERATRTCRNPQTGEKMTIDAKKIVKFKIGKSLAEAINK